MATYYARNRFAEGILPEVVKPVVNLDKPASDNLYWSVWVADLRSHVIGLIGEDGEDILQGYLFALPPAGNNKEMYMQLKKIEARLTSIGTGLYSADEYSEPEPNWRDCQG